MTVAHFASGVLTAGVLSDDHRAVVWAVASSPGPVSIERLTSALADQSCEASQMRPRLDCVLADLQRSGLVDIAWTNDSGVVGADYRPAANGVVAVTERGTRLAAELFIC